MQFKMPMWAPGPLEEQKFRETMGWGAAQQPGAPEDPGGQPGGHKNPFQASMPTVGLGQNTGQGFVPPPPQPGQDSVFAQLLDPRRQQLAQLTKQRTGGMG